MNPSTYTTNPLLQKETTPFVLPTQTESVSEPSLISSAQGERVVADTTKKLDELKGEPLAEVSDKGITTNAVQTPPKETGNADVVKDFTTYINPETGQETTLKGDAITDEARKDLESKGYVVSEEEKSKSSLDALTAESKKAEAELNTLMLSLEETAITSKELRQQTKRIKKAYGARIKQAEELNRRRQQSLNTLGIRLGSRYTGGAGGTMGSILAEEERQGLARIDVIENEMLAAIAGAEKAAKEHNFTLYTKLVEKAQEKYDAKVKAFQDLETAQKKAEAELNAETELVENQASIVEQVQAGTKDPFEIFTALGGKVPFDMIKEMTDTLPDQAEQYTLGRYEVRYDATGKVIARGMGEGGTGETNVGGGTSFGSPSVSVGSPTVAGLGATYDKSTAEAQMLIDDIMNKIPAQLRNTEKEVELKKEQIRKQLAAGYTYQQVVDRLSGFSLQGEKTDKAVGNALYNLSLGTDLDVGQLASLLNRGANEQAMTTVENKQLESVDAFFAPVDKARSTVKQADNVLNILNDPAFPKDKLGAFDGRVFKLARQVSPAEQVKIQQLESALQLLNAPLRVEIVGTAATPSEMSKVTGFQAEVLDQPDILKSKVQDLRDAVLRFHNEARSQRGLPQVTNTQLVDNKKRLDLYREIGNVDQGMANANLGTNDFLSSGAWNGSTPAKESTGDNATFFSDL
jgi:hypothetical protein